MLTEKDEEKLRLDVGQYYIGLTPNYNLSLYQVQSIKVDDSTGIYSPKFLHYKEQCFYVKDIIYKNNREKNINADIKLGIDWGVAFDCLFNTYSSFHYCIYHQNQNTKWWLFDINIDIQGARPLMVIPKEATLEEALLLFEASKGDLMKEVNSMKEKNERERKKYGLELYGHERL